MRLSAFMPPRVDIFCKIVDNFGDIGVSWRLARQLATEHGWTIQLWVDDVALAKQFAGVGHPRITLQHWHETAAFTQAADVVIETFGCELPAAYQQAMLRQRSLWLNVDYLSAEPWVESFHAQPSPQANGLVRHFFYPGFTPATGGLLREASLPALHADAQWQALGLTAAPDMLTLSLFCYAHAPLAALVESLQHSPRPVRLMVPETIAPMLAATLGVSQLQVGECIARQQCTYCILPFLSQTDYDRLLTLCDFNFVRGEDSWIRALWAGKPMIWQPYQQSEDTHLRKLEAFMDHYLPQSTDTTAQHSLRNAMLAWAQGTWQAEHWQALLLAWPQISHHATAFKIRQSQQADLVTNLVIFIEKCLAHRV